MPGVRIVTDSACDLTPQLVERYGITVVPLTIRFGDEELLDRRDLSPAEFWRRCKSAASLPATAAPSPGEFQKSFEAAADGADGILCLTLSSSVSATYQSAVAAADSFGAVPVHVIDTRSMSMGQGLLAVAAAESAGAGTTLDALVSEIEGCMARTRVLAVVDTLDHLQRGGRIGGARALLGSMLSIKPVIQVRDGVVAQESRQRTRFRSLEYVANKVRSDAPLDRLGIANGAATDIDDLLAMLADVPVEHETIVVDLGPVVGTHAGPGTIGICYQVAGIGRPAAILPP